MDRQLTRKQWGLLFYDTPKCVCVCDCSVSVLQIEQNNMNSCWECLNVEQPWKNRTTSSDWLVSPQYSLVKEQITASKNFVNFDEPSWHPAHNSGLAYTSLCVCFGLPVLPDWKTVFQIALRGFHVQHGIFFFVSSQKKIAYISLSCARCQMVRIYLFRLRAQMYL